MENDMSDILKVMARGYSIRRIDCRLQTDVTNVFVSPVVMSQLEQEKYVVVRQHNGLGFYEITDKGRKAIKKARSR